MEYGDSSDKKMKDAKLQKAKEKYEKSQQEDEEKIFRLSSVLEIIDASLIKLNKDYADVLLQNSVEASFSSELTTWQKKRKKEYESKKLELEEAKEDYITQEGKTFSAFLLEIEKSKNLYGSNVYGPVGIGKDTYSNLRNNKTKEPTFETCVQLIFAFKLDLNDSTELLRLAGRAFSDRKYHRLVKYFIENKDYNLFSLNEDLDKMKIKAIGCLQ